MSYVVLAAGSAGFMGGPVCQRLAQQLRLASDEPSALTADRAIIWTSAPSCGLEVRS